jgi:hypothetical protein
MNIVPIHGRSAPPAYHSIWKDATDQHFAALLLGRDEYPHSYGIDASRLRNATWNTESYADHEFVVWHAPTPQFPTALPNLAIFGDSFSVYFRNVGLERYFDTIMATSGTADTPAVLQTFQHNTVKYIVVQMRDVSLPLLLAQQHEQ